MTSRRSSRICCHRESARPRKEAPTAKICQEYFVYDSGGLCEAGVRFMSCQGFNFSFCKERGGTAHVRAFDALAPSIPENHGGHRFFFQLLQ